MLTFGGVDKDYYTGEFVFAPLTSPNEWKFALDDVEVPASDEFISGESGQARLDTSLPLIYGPAEDVYSLHALLGGRPHKTRNGMYAFDCAEVYRLPDVMFIVNGQWLPLSSKHYVIQFSDHYSCVFISVLVVKFISKLADKLSSESFSWFF
ncbi:cathepsin e-a [Plakobranchus ocellatus]|uniref:Cathepsin e-a n=1 Tax=Plakobranchus ocellatus TaxID=259542 RepID=A0AAV4C1N3_9GAST|nr:cathepsin e-a [Plakobranchus ocellatus]